MALLPLYLFAQKTDPAATDITGLWKGTMYNDTTQTYYSYEIGISKEKNKLSGFSHTWFVLDNKKYYAVKKVKVKIVDGKLIVQDNGLIAHNYTGKPDKGVYQLNVLELEMHDSIMKLSGPFITNRTRMYNSLTGTIDLQRKKDYWQSSLVPHLQELGVVKSLSFVEDTFSLSRSMVMVNPKEGKVPSVKTAIKTPEKKEIEIGGAVSKKASNNETAIASAEAVTKTDPETLAANQLPQQKIIPVAAAEVESRLTVAQQTVYFRSDSLQLTLYDNGEVDGDTVSVLMNGVIIMAKQGLSTNAIRKTIFIDPQADSIQLLMYAENLGSIPPNTGLLVVKDGKETYEVRFSGDFQRNAAVIFRRKK
jgi:hypothetical protein